MLAYDDPRWGELQGGYRSTYDPRPALKLLESRSDADAAWAELWEELHHQGDVGLSSFAAVPHLVRIHRSRGLPDWNTYQLVSVIELARDSAENPVLAEWLRDSYEQAWKDLVETGCRDLLATQSPTLPILGALALAAGDRRLGRLLVENSESELSEAVATYIEDAG
ncbi:hypothetical protein Pla163_08440 [Planctomycetes bacterium Pla163]|uniref:Uncharacterized protein n=1 Tax=Rohdeia mirabilis TaxID=2528008 RepID=A0A518CWY9_9BACT|nr:hypothetical protein Pla163_08440 [Planctomycetes bacterium Pla163]